MKREKNYFIVFLIISVLILIYLFFLLSNIGKITEYNFFSEASGPPVEIQKSVLIYIYPALYLYIGSCIYFLIKKINYRKVIYPVTISVLIIFANIIGVFKCGGSFIWSIFLTFFPTVWIIVMSIEFGMSKDEKYQQKENIIKE